MGSQLGVEGVPENFNFFSRVDVRTRSSVLPKQTGDDSERSYLARSLIRFDVGLQYPFFFWNTQKNRCHLKLLFSQKRKDVTWDFSVVGFNMVYFSLEWRPVLCETSGIPPLPPNLRKRPAASKSTAFCTTAHRIDDLNFRRFLQRLLANVQAVTV